MKKDKMSDVLRECFRELYLASTPSVNFDDLVANATINEYGEKDIPFNDHLISESKFYEILKSVLKKSNLTKWEKHIVEKECFLGCSPKFESDKNEIK